MHFTTAGSGSGHREGMCVGGRASRRSERACIAAAQPDPLRRAPSLWQPAPTAPDETRTTLWPASWSAATASHSLVICGDRSA